MCLICVELEKDRLTLDEAYRNLGEMRSSLSDEHVAEVKKLLEKKKEEEQEEDTFDEEEYEWEEIPFGD